MFVLPAEAGTHRLIAEYTQLEGPPPDRKSGAKGRGSSVIRVCLVFLLVFIAASNL